MQLYAGLPVITNKITIEEQQGIPHHLLGCIGREEQTWVVGAFVKNALDIIDEIRSRGKLPILVGGTHYYTQSLLFKDNLTNVDEWKDEFVEDTHAHWPILSEPTPVILQELRKVDPVMADRWHPNDRRKIQRSLEIYLQSGRKTSDVYADQRKPNTQSNDSDPEAGSTLVDGPCMRFPTLLLWVHADTEILKSRLDSRVDNMMDHGLIDEVKTLNDFAQAQAESRNPVDETRGIWVSIGYKEFKNYANALVGGVCDELLLQRMCTEALEMTKAATRQYAKRQLRWIRIKLANALAQANATSNLYVLDGSDVSAFDQNVVEPSLKLTRDFLDASNSLPDPASISATAAEMLAPKRNYDHAATPEKWTRQHCEICGVTCVTEDQWQQHVSSKAHKKLTSKRRKAAALEDGKENSIVVERAATEQESTT
jgi:tRNA dimethylallyltransferase